MKQITGLLFILSLLAPSAKAEKMDGSTHNFLVEKLERAIEATEKNDETLVPLMKRLADLYAERARIKEMDEIGKEEAQRCPVCPASLDDRKKSIKIYNQLLVRKDIEDKGDILIQLAHIHLLLGQQKEALKVFEDVIKKTKDYSPSLVGAAHAGLGEIYYSKQNMKKATQHLESALKIGETKKKGLLTYRLAWCYLNQGRVSQATQKIEQILKTPALLSTEASQGSQIDTVFQEEVSRDFATFLAKGHVDRKVIENYVALSPEQARTDNLSYLASELDRTGKKQAALIAWQMVNLRQINPNKKLEGHIRMAQVNYDMNDRSQTLSEIRSGVEHWKNSGCKKDESCEELQSKLKKLITDWDRATKKTMSPELAEAYKAYLSLFDKDTEMTYWGANSLHKHKMFVESGPLYHRAAMLAKKDLKKAEASEEKKKLNNIFEGSLLAQIEAAESSKDPKARIAAYENYIDQNPKGERISEVKYQVAQVFYEQGDYKRAHSVFKTIALDDRTPREIALKSADLTLDCLNLMKDEPAIQQQAEEFAVRFPERKTEFVTLSRKSTLNQIAHSVNSPQTSTSELKRSLVAMNAVSLAGASEKEKTQLYKDRIVVAEKLKDLSQVILNCNLLLKAKSSTKEDKDFANSRKLWALEMGFNFKEAYVLSKRTGLPHLSEADKHLKLAVLAELANLSAQKHYRDFLKVTSKAAAARQVMVLLVRQSSNSTKTFAEFESKLRADRELYSQLVLEDFARTKNQSLALKRLHSGVGSTVAGRNISRMIQIMNFDRENQQLAWHRINKSQKHLKSSLNERLRLLRSSERKAQVALNSRDWSLQVLHIHFIRNQYTRLAREISQLPVPANLNSKMKTQYRHLLVQQASPYLEKSNQLAHTLEKLWGQSKILDSLLNDYANVKRTVRPLLALEIKKMMEIAPSSVRRELMAAMTEQKNHTNFSQITQARRELKEDPFNIRRLEKLKTLESEAGRNQVAGYLDARIRQIQSGGI
ncbi:MAG: hypothetical protein AB7F59_08630 [Bdellovibrionales bacterium]